MKVRDQNSTHKVLLTVDDSSSLSHTLVKHLGQPSHKLVAESMTGSLVNRKEGRCEETMATVARCNLNESETVDMRHNETVIDRSQVNVTTNYKNQLSYRLETWQWIILRDYCMYNDLVICLFYLLPPCLMKSFEWHRDKGAKKIVINANL